MPAAEQLVVADDGTEHAHTTISEVSRYIFGTTVYFTYQSLWLGLLVVKHVTSDAFLPRAAAREGAALQPHVPRRLPERLAADRWAAGLHLPHLPR